MPKFCAYAWSFRSAVLVLALVGTNRASAQDAPLRMIPSMRYFVAQNTLYEGEYLSALKTFQGENRNSIKTAASSWIDAICYRTMMGECYYHLGQYTQALDQYNSALQLYIAFSDWMLSVNFPANVPLDVQRARRQPPWGMSTRPFKLGKIPDTMPIAQGQLNNSDVVQKGGVVQQAMLIPINVPEIVRATALAIRRRRELMGPVCKHDPFSAQLVAKLSRRPGPPNHWSEAWIDLLLGLAQASENQKAQAERSLSRALLLGGEFDHPLTCVAMVELGKLALEGGKLNEAAKFFEEASYSAFYYDDLAVIDEALRLGQRVHLMANKQGPYPPLVNAARWARANRARHLELWATCLQAENLAFLGDSQNALKLATACRGMMRRDMATSVLAAQSSYVLALVGFQRGQVTAGNEALASALALQEHCSLWMFQIMLADTLFMRGSITSRVAVDLYKPLLRDPTSLDWAYSPLESLSKLSIPHPAVYEHWFNAALDRKEIETAIQITDRVRSNRYHTLMPLGGRLQALRTVLGTDPKQLPPDVQVQRQELLSRYPAYEALEQQAVELRNKLLDLPLVPSESEQARDQSKKLSDLAKLSDEQEALLLQIALRREGAAFLFPPIRTTKEIQTGLGPGQCALMFFSTSQGMHAFLLNKERYAHWRIGAGPELQRTLAKLLRELGNYDSNRELTLSDLTNTRWKQSAARVTQLLVKDAKIDLTKGIQELVIVPDGVMWYVPFECLPLGTDSDKPMLARIRLRYAPTLSLSVPQRPANTSSRSTAVVLGKLFPRDKADVAAEAFKDFERSVPSAVALPESLPAAPNLYKTLIPTLVVLDDLEVEGPHPLAWSPIKVPRAKSAGAIAHWNSLPLGGPDQVVLPGFHSAAETGLKKFPAGAGNELFLSITSLMASGARTVLISRWRPGGQTSFDLTREFVQELPHTSAADAWQRSVELAKTQPLNWELEPRLKKMVVDKPPAAEHPFFWSGYMVVDTGSRPQSAETVKAENAAPAELPPAK